MSELEEFKLLETGTKSKAKIIKIDPPVQFLSKWKKESWRFNITCSIEGQEAEINFGIFCTAKGISPRTTLGKLLRKYNIQTPNQLIGKEIELILTDSGFWQPVI